MQLPVESKHSLEMHLPYIQQVMGDTPYLLVPIMVGALSESAEARASSSPVPCRCRQPLCHLVRLCHWGERFQFQYFDKKHGPEIYQSIEALDHQGMALIEAQDCKGFAKYQRDFHNTICGRHPIGVLLQMLAHCQAAKHQLKFVRYAQSSRCRSPDDSSVSYASAVVWM